MRDIRFYDVVSVDALLAQLAADRDRPAVCTVIAELLLNSFFATSDADKDRGAAPSIGQAQVQRCLHFVRMHPDAAVAFYSCLYRHVSLGRIAKFLVILVSLLFTSPSPAADRKLKRGRSQQVQKLNLFSSAFTDRSVSRRGTIRASPVRSKTSMRRRECRCCE